MLCWRQKTSRLMDPALCDEFCKEYTRHTNRLRGESNAKHKVDRAALVKIERGLDRLVQALMDGVPGGQPGKVLGAERNL